MFRPGDRPEDEKLATIILCHGWGGVAASLRTEAIAFARAGFATIAFDYRGWGASDGRVILVGPRPKEVGKDRRFTAEVQEIRGVVDPIEQATDLQNAVHWAAGEPGVDPGRIGLWGSSYSGGHVVYVAARDPRVRCLVSQVPSLDSRWVGAGPQLAATAREASRMARGELGYPEPGAVVIGSLRARRSAPSCSATRRWRTWRRPGAAPCCSSWPRRRSCSATRTTRGSPTSAPGPKEYVVLPGITHYGVYREARPKAIQVETDWFTAHLKPPGEAPG